MKIKAYNRTSIPDTGRVARNGRVQWKVVAFIVLALAAINVSVGLGFALHVAEIKTWIQDRGYQAINPYQTSKSVIKRAPEILGKMSGLTFLGAKDVNIPELSIDIKFKHLQKLSEKRADAMKTGILLKGPDDFVPAMVRYGSRVVKVKVRLKGDMTDHLRGKKWSLRIETKGDDHILGFRRFSIQHPRTRGFHLQALIREMWRIEATAAKI